MNTTYSTSSEWHLSQDSKHTHGKEQRNSLGMNSGEELTNGSSKKCSGEKNAIRTMHYTLNGREYVISEHGEVVRMPTAYRPKPRILKPTKTANGYLRLCLPVRHKFVHQMVYEAFNGPIPDGMDIDHINGIRDDNSLTNLRAVPRNVNALNRRSANRNSKSGIRGVHFHKRSGYWVFSVNKKQIASSKSLKDVSDIALEYWSE